MLKTLVLENFKAFGGRQEIPLAPITLIFGANSAGKSSILQSLLLLKQTIDEARSPSTVLLPRASLVDLGSFKEMAFAHDTSRIWEISPLLEFQERPLRPTGSRGVIDALSRALQPNAPVGPGFRFSFGPTGDLELACVPYYFGRTDSPLYTLTPTRDLPGRENIARFGLRSPRTRVDFTGEPGFVGIDALENLSASHALWAMLFDEFTNRLEKRVRDIKETLRDIEVLDELAKEEEVARARKEELARIIQSIEDRLRKLRRDSGGTRGATADQDPRSGKQQEELEEELREKQAALAEVTAMQERMRPLSEFHMFYTSTLRKTNRGDDREAYLETKERTRKTLTEQLERFSEYNFALFLEDVVATNSALAVAVKNYLPIQGIPRRRPEPDVAVRTSPDQRDTEYRFFGTSWTTRHTDDDTTPDLVSLSTSLSSALLDQLNSLRYLAPLREYPERHYIFSGNVPTGVGKTGEQVADLLYKNERLVKQTNEVLEEFGTGYQLKVVQYIAQSPGGRDPAIEDVIGLRLVDQWGTSVSMPDVGFGISQVLPVIVESMLSTRKLILIEQPEIHLHPALQAELGSLFAKCVTGTQKHQFIIETHSEHLILRLRRILRQGQLGLKPSDISIIYVQRDPMGPGSTCIPIQLDERGDFLDEWPGGFFEESFREMFL